MPITIKVATRWFDCPNEGKLAVSDLLKDLSDKDTKSVYVQTFIFTHTELLKAFLALRQRIKPAPANVFVLHDLSQWSVEDKGSLKSQSTRWKPLIEAGCDVTLTTSTTPDSFLPGGYDYNHRKTIVIAKAKSFVCYTGSVNFTMNGFEQTGDITRFISSVWATRFIKSFERNRQFARSTLAKYQIA